MSFNLFHKLNKFPSKKISKTPLLPNPMAFSFILVDHTATLIYFRPLLDTWCSLGSMARN